MWELNEYRMNGVVLNTLMNRLSQRQHGSVLIPIQFNFHWILLSANGT